MGSTSRAAFLGRDRFGSFLMLFVGLSLLNAPDIDPVLLFGVHGLVQVPQLQGSVLGGRQQHRLARVEGQRADGVEVAAQREAGVPRLLELLPVVLHLRGTNAEAGSALVGERIHPCVNPERG